MTDEQILDVIGRYVTGRLSDRRRAQLILAALREAVANDPQIVQSLLPPGASLVAVGPDDIVVRDASDKEWVPGDIAKLGRYWMQDSKLAAENAENQPDYNEFVNFVFSEAGVERP